VNYAGDANWNPASLTQTYTFNTLQTSPSPSTISLTVSPSTINSGQAATFTATVQGSQGAVVFAGGLVSLYANGALFFQLFLAPSPTTNMMIGSVTVPGSSLPSGNLQVVAVFGGTSTLAPSTSAPVSLTVNATNFQMSLGVARLAIKSGSSGSAPLQLIGPNGGNVIVQLACAPSSPTFTCLVAPSSPNVSGSTAATLTINAYVMSTTTTAALAVDAFHGYSSAALGFFLGCVFLVLTPRKRIRSALLMVLVLCTLTLTIGSCGGGGSSSPPPPPPPRQVNTPAGSYSVLVTATSPSNTHNVKLTVDVQ
jgi:hypothetical protein